MIFPLSDDLAHHSRSQLRLKRDKCLTCSIYSHISDTFLISWHNYLLMLLSMILTLMKCVSGSAKAKYQRWMISTTKQAISVKLAATVGHFLSDLDFENVYKAWPTCFSFFGPFLWSFLPSFLLSFFLLSFLSSFFVRPFDFLSVFPSFLPFPPRILPSLLPSFLPSFLLSSLPSWLPSCLPFFRSCCSHRAALAINLPQYD